MMNSGTLPTPTPIHIFELIFIPSGEKHRARRGAEHWGSSGVSAMRLRHRPRHGSCRCRHEVPERTRPGPRVLRIFFCG